MVVAFQFDTSAIYMLFKVCGQRKAVISIFRLISDAFQSSPTSQQEFSTKATPDPAYFECDEGQLRS